MPRPRSLFGLVAYLAALYLRKHPVAAAVVACGCAALIAIGVRSAADVRAPGSSAPGLQVATLRDGFVIAEQHGDVHHVREVERSGSLRHAIEVAQRASAARVVGARNGTVFAWLAGKKLRLALVGDDGRLGAPSTWGRSATQLCDGVATGDHRFGVGWLERDGRVWFVHGPTGAALATAVPATEVPASGAEATARISWCGIAAADDHIALFWREGTRVFLNMCSEKGCSALITRVPLHADHELIAYGCVRDECAAAFRKPDGSTHLGWFDLRGKVAWSRPLAAAAGSRIAMATAGPRAIAVSYVGAHGAEVVRVTRAGAFHRVWSEPAAHEAPALAWSRDRLLVAHRREGVVSTAVVKLPR